jgi:quinol-cytochrome oxidoreductase complex cytochrome b subunit
VSRSVVLVVALTFIAGFAFLTVAAAIESGVTAATVVSAFVLVLLAVGIVGALRNPPRR